MNKLFPASLLVVTLTCGCFQSVSESRRTSEIRMIFRADRIGNGKVYLNVRAYDTRSGLGWIDALPLSSGDELSASSGNQSVQLHGGTGTLNTDGPLVTISLQRAEHQNAPNTVISFPEPFVLEEIQSKVSRSQRLTVRWRPTGSGPMSVEAKGSCIKTTHETVDPDTGAVALDIRPRSESEEASSCDVALTVTRTRLGTVDKALGSSSKAFGREIRSVTFESVQ